uniref:Uncharacterized protein n=1 Tax=Brassica oleracea var. oleracea TaxID=109376 RepID=A0A0D3A6B7_BRAOL
MPTDASTCEEKERNPCDIWAASSIVKGAKHSEKTKGKMKQSEFDGDDYDVDKHDEKKKGNMKQDEVDGDDYDAANINSEKENREKLAKSPLVELVKTGYLFLNKTVLKARFELCAMKHNFHYTVTNSDKSVWCLRCADKVCFWGARVECLKGSTYFIIKKYVGVHSCAPSSKTSAGKTASAKTIGGLIMHKYEAWREAYQESINPIAVPEDDWSVPQVVENSEVLPPETRRSLGRNRKRRYETVEDKIRSSQRSQGGQLRKCSRCGLGGHNRATCKMRI